jgi:flagellar biosynthesis GTPase FlhF
MNPLRFDAPTMRQALDQVRARLGDDAVIVDSHTRPDNGSAGGVTVLAAPGGRAGLPRPAEKPSNSVATGQALDRAPSPELSRTIGADVRACRSMLEALLAGRACSDSAAGDSASRDRLAASVPLAGGISVDAGPAVVALVGPTGGGKTTTAARLAASVGIAAGRRTRVITGDTHRAHAREMLEACCSILGLQVELAPSPAEVAAACRQDSAEITLLDTPGISARDESSLRELAEWLAAAAPTEVHLVAPATASRASFAAAAEAFGRLGADRVILTKVDEPADLPEALTALIASGKRLSYVTDCPGAADGLRLADEDLLARLLASHGEEADHAH